MGNNPSYATTSPIPQYQTYGGPTRPAPGPSGPIYQPGPAPRYGAAPPSSYPPERRYGPGPGPSGDRYGPPSSGPSNDPYGPRNGGRPGVQLGDRGRPYVDPYNSRPPVMQPRSYPPDLQGILDDDFPDVFQEDQDVFRGAPRRQGPQFGGDPNGIEDYIRRKIDKDGRLQAEDAQRYRSRPPGASGGGPVQQQRENKYRAQPQYFHIQPPPGQPSTHVFRYDSTTGTLAVDGSGGQGGYGPPTQGGYGPPTQGGYGVETYNLPPVFDYQGGSQGPSLAQAAPFVFPQQPQVVSPSFGFPGPYGGY